MNHLQVWLLNIYVRTIQTTKQMQNMQKEIIIFYDEKLGIELDREVLKTNSMFFGIFGMGSAIFIPPLLKDYCDIIE